MKVYCLLITQTYDFEVFPARIPIVSTDKQKVIDALKVFADGEKSEIKEKVDNGEWIIENDTDEWFEAYEDGRYSENHSLAVIIEREMDVLDWREP
jgi:hypothetical protein